MTLQQMVSAAQTAAAQAQQAADQALSALDALSQQQNANSAGGSASFIASTLCLPFWYQVSSGVMSGNAVNITVPLQMAADSTFELLRILCISSLDNPTDYAPNNFSVQLQDGSSGRYLSAEAIPQAAFGTRSYQYGSDEKYPVRFPANTTVNCVFNNLIAANLTATIFLKGYKFFQIGPNPSPTTS